MPGSGESLKDLDKTIRDDDEIKCREVESH